MENYDIIKTLGDGAFGIVYQAINKETKQIVAIKEFKKKFFNFEECKNLREVKSLSKLNQHENLIKILQMIFKEDKTLLLVFDYMKENLYELMKSRSIKKFTEGQIKCIMYQVIKGIAYMHKHGFFHRDLKPENILVDGDLVKIADFGLAREVRSVPPYTDYVSTRWYRAPECLLKSTNYNSPVDIWALGCIMIELFNLKPIFPGNSEKDVLYKICSTIGVPNNNSETSALAKKINFKFPSCLNSPTLSSIVPGASEDAISILNEMLQWDPNKRAIPSALLNHPFFTKGTIPDKISTPDEFKFISGKGKVYGSNIKKLNKNNFNDDNEDTEEDLNAFLENTQDFNKFVHKLKEDARKDDENYAKSLSPPKNKENTISYKKDDIHKHYNSNNSNYDKFNYDLSKQDNCLLNKNWDLGINTKNITENNYSNLNNVKNTLSPLKNKELDSLTYNNNKDLFKKNVVNNSQITIDNILNKSPVKNNILDNKEFEFPNKYNNVLNKTNNANNNNLNMEFGLGIVSRRKKNIDNNIDTTSSNTKSNVYNYGGIISNHGSNNSINNNANSIITTNKENILDTLLQTSKYI